MAGIVPGYDWSPGAQRVLEIAIEQARAFGEPLVLVHGGYIRDALSLNPPHSLVDAVVDLLGCREVAGVVNGRSARLFHW